MLRILIVDDSLVTRKLIGQIVDTTGHIVAKEAKDAMEAIEIYKKNYLDIDVITMDIDMPDVSGVVAVKKIIEINKDAKIIMLTSRGQENVVKDSIKAGAIGYLLKPVTVNNFEKAIELIS